jgi:putative serine/threonine protein kinase
MQNPRNTKIRKISLIGKGWSSYIWLAEAKTGAKKIRCVVKEVREKSPRKNLAEREGKFLKLANSASVGPKIILADEKNNFVAMEFIKGKSLLNWILESGEKNSQKISKKQLYYFIKELYKQLLALDSVHLSHNQLQVGKNILVQKNGRNYFPAIIDFEKATLKEKTKNIGQIESFLFYNPNGAVAKKVREILNVRLC